MRSIEAFNDESSPDMYTKCCHAILVAILFHKNGAFLLNYSIYFAFHNHQA